MKNQEDKKEEKTEAELLREVSTCLLDYLKEHKKTSNPFEILQFLAENTLKKLEEGKEAKFNNFALQEGVMGQIGPDPSSWLSPVWKKLNTHIRQEREEGLQQYAAKDGLTHYPWVKKLDSSGGAGNQALYFIEAIPIPPQAFKARPELNLPKVDIEYILEKKLIPSWWGRYLFDADFKAKGWRKHIFIWPQVFWIISMLILGALILYAMSLNTSQVTTSTLASFFIALAILAYTAWSFMKIVRLLDDRLAMAPELMLGLREYGVCIEVMSPEEPGKIRPRSLRLVKYAAICPTCKAQVLLDKGEPDFPRRIVGRCHESPREHVFSFDRVSQTGYRLR
ncbi:MAG: hypothetical protein ACRDD3_07940 [Azovibrio sp.]